MIELETLIKKLVKNFVKLNYINSKEKTLEIKTIKSVTLLTHIKSFYIIKAVNISNNVYNKKIL